MQSQVTFNRVPEKVPEKVAEKVWFLEESVGGFGAEPGHVQQVFREGCGEGLFGAEPGQVQQGCREGSGEGLGGFGVAEKAWETLVQSQVRFNRVPDKVPEGFGAEPG